MRTFMVIALALAAQSPPEISLPPGDAVRGKAVFESSKADCLSCHRVNGNGSRFGPDLSMIGAPPRGSGGGGGRGTAPPPAAAPARGATAAPAFGGDEAANARIGAAPPLPAAAPAAAGPTVQQLAQSILDPNALVTV